ncbi:unnamed protein product, partial [Larinioides sclopetarius]
MDGISTEKYDKKLDYIFSTIFGNTDDEEEFQGFNEEDVKLATKRAKKKYKKFKSLVLGKGIEKHRKGFKEGYRKSVHDQDYRKYHFKGHCKFYKKESKRNLKTEYIYEPTFSTSESSENESNSCDEIDIKSWIFRDTDDEDEEFEGFTEEDLYSNVEEIIKKCFKKDKTDVHSGRENNGKMSIKDEMQRYRRCSLHEGRDEDEEMFSNAESDDEMDVKWFTHVMKILENSIEKDENDENDQRI